MSEFSNSAKVKLNPLDTLAQSRTSISNDWLLVNGKGSDISNTITLISKVKRKTITQKMVLSLIDVANKKKKGERVKTYWNTYHCQNRLITSQGRSYTKYCKNRFCTICLSIRKATIINKYMPLLETWEDCHFVTLTVRAIPAKYLSRYFKGMIKVFSMIVEKHRKQSKRNAGIPLIGIRSLECNFNPKRRTYNPHFHVLVQSREMGEILITDWLKRFTNKHALRCGQHIRKVNDTQRDMIELIKYGSKIFTEPDLKKKGNPQIFVSALDNILSAMEGRRIFDRFGFNLPSTNCKSNDVKLLSNCKRWVFDLKIGDWINNETGEILCGHQPNIHLMEILNNRIDLTLQ